MQGVTGGGALRTGPLAMHPSVGFASLAKGYVNKEWRFLSDTPLCRLSEKKKSGCKKSPQSDILASEKELFGRCHHQRYRRRRVANRHVLAEGYIDKTLVSIPFPNTALAMYLLIGFP